MVFMVTMNLYLKMLWTILLYKLNSLTLLHFFTHDLCLDVQYIKALYIGVSDSENKIKKKKLLMMDMFEPFSLKRFFIWVIVQLDIQKGYYDEKRKIFVFLLEDFLCNLQYVGHTRAGIIILKQDTKNLPISNSFILCE